MTYAELYAKRIRSLCKKRGISINQLAKMGNVRKRPSITSSTAGQVIRAS